MPHTSIRDFYLILLSPYLEGSYVQLLGNEAPKCHATEGIVCPNSLMVVYVDPLTSAMAYHVQVVGCGHGLRGDDLGGRHPYS